MPKLISLFLMFVFAGLALGELVINQNAAIMAIYGYVALTFFHSFKIRTQDDRIKALEDKNANQSQKSS